jgi:protein-tyrosine kinase
MSRIQDILAKAERDGTARRTQPTSTFSPGAAPAVFPPPALPRVDGTSALDDVTFSPATLSPAATAPAPVAPTAAAPPAVTLPPAVDTRPPVAVPRTEVVETRTAAAVLHPLLVAAIDPHSEIAERYRSIRARISHREETTPMRTVLVTSPRARDGKSITAANLALTMAQEIQRRVVLVDTDFRHSTLHSLFGLEVTPGLTDVLQGEATLDEAMVYLPDYRLTVIAAGRTPQFPTELLGSAAMRRVVDTLRGRFDRVLFDSPAVMPLADAGTFGPMADGVLMVVRAGSTQRPALNQALAAFDEERLLGVVLNDTV